ncbi:MAG: hypothetical protein AAGD96_13995 [Chloroflexota bacterium]
MSDQTFLFEQGLVTCQNNGLNLSVVFDVNELPAEIHEKSSVNLLDYSRLVLLGNGGQLFWEALDRYGWPLENPVDSFSLHLTQNLLESFSKPADSSLILYPQQSHMIPLQQLGSLAGWGTPSPIGNSIHPQFGLWFAFRAAFLTTVKLPVTHVNVEQSPCETCRKKPCQTACPVNAVKGNSEQFELYQCIDHRVKEGSSCRSKCLARLACPVGREHRYPRKAIEYLYLSSVRSIAAWKARQIDGN